MCLERYEIHEDNFVLVQYVEIISEHPMVTFFLQHISKSK
jgi:hypothetical protein